MDLESIFRQCMIVFDGQECPLPDILHANSDFLLQSLKQDRNRTVSLTAPTLLMPIVAAVAFGLHCVVRSQETADKVIPTLPKDTYVIFEGSRARYKGLTKEGYAIIEQSGKKGNGPIKSTVHPARFHQITPYYGDATVLDKRGVQNPQLRGKAFLKELLEVDDKDVPIRVPSSVVIISDRATVDAIMKHTELRLPSGADIRIGELFPSAYYSEDKCYLYSGNATKAEPILKFTGRTSTARELIIGDSDSDTCGLIVCTKDISKISGTELNGLFLRRSLPHVAVLGLIEYTTDDLFLRQNEEFTLFAWTHGLVRHYSETRTSNEGSLSSQLAQMLEAMLHQTAGKQVLGAPIPSDEYNAIRKSLWTISRTNCSGIDTELFILIGFSLLRLFTYSTAPMQLLERQISKGELSGRLPIDQIGKLRELSTDATGMLLENMSTVIQGLTDFYFAIQYMPVHTVAQMDFDNHDPQVPDKAFQMKYLSDLDATGEEDKLAALNEIVESYGRWITNPDDPAAPGIEQIAATLSDHHSEAASRHLTQCKEAYRRMKAGLQTLSENDKAYAAFLLANRAMLMQRIHMGIQSRESLPDDPELQEYMVALDYYHAEAYYPGGREPAWRPFQLAFLLMSVNSIVTPELPERDIVDLIWFPTGGGKTEAYLGLTAFTIFYRRMAHPGEYGGTTVIMRYTLRLLASQQFVRAGTLICACEAIRKDSARKKKYPSYDLGTEPITIGLWIGGTHTPNRNTGADDCAEKHLGELNSATAKSLKYAKERHNKFQILKCPWCGTKLVKEVDSTGKKLVGQWGYEMKDGKHFYMHCPQEGCLFEARLPIQVVDEELYENPPTLLFGTVDKFAMMAWNGAVASFFGSYSENRAPELIIQDELHLISGPLGTMVGLYEAAIDKLCSKKGVRPKIVASTATIRRAKDQCASLYNREVRQFPPPGLDAEDSYFSREASLDEKPGRIFLGVMPAGKTKAMMEVRLISTILQRVHMMPFSDEVKDKFWTLATYFNSLRDLGKCSTLVDDDVKDNIRRMAYRFGRRNGARPTGAASELTSRVSTTQLNDTLDRLEHLTYSEENQKNRKYAIGVLLATNMISVGVDVDRLNIMLLVGQPKLTSEYIQASSRVGRTYPGMAVVLYDGSKSRDRSHYEQFHAYHDSFYKYVEPTGLTPFSKPARDRAMHAVAISLMRLAHGFVADESAAMFDKDLPAVKEVQDYILQRAREINDRMDFPLSDETPAIEQELADFWEKWAEDLAAAGEENFRFGYRYIMTPPSGDARRLIKSFGSGHDQAIDTPTSMRNVDQSIASNIIVWE